MFMQQRLDSSASTPTPHNNYMDAERTPGMYTPAGSGAVVLFGENGDMQERVTSALRHAADMKRQFLDNLRCLQNSSDEDE